MVRRLLRPWKPSTRDDPLPRASSGAASRYSSSSNSSVIVGAGAAASARVPSRLSTTFSRGAAKVTLLRFVRGGGGGVGVRFMLEVFLLDSRQSEESRDTSKSRYFVSVRSSRLEFVLSSPALPFDNTGEVLPVGLETSCGEVNFSSAHLDAGKRIGDGVLPVRSTMGCICHQNTLTMRWR